MQEQVLQEKVFTLHRGHPDKDPRGPVLFRQKALRRRNLSPHPVQVVQDQPVRQGRVRGRDVREDEGVVTGEDLKPSIHLPTQIRTTSLPPRPVGPAREAPHGPISPNTRTPTLTVEVLTTVNLEGPRASRHSLIRAYTRVIVALTRTVHTPERARPHSLVRVLTEDSVLVVRKGVMVSLRDRTQLE